MKGAGWCLVAVLVVAGCTASPASTAAPSNSGATTSPSAAGESSSNQDPARFATLVVEYAREAGVHAQLLMAILYNEDYKPHDPAVERAWQKIKPDAAFGVANMHKATFDEVKRGRPFAGRDWQELPDHPDLAIESAAWYLHDLAAQLPSARSGYTVDELIALGYNAGPGNMRAFAKGTKPGVTAQSYLDSLHGNWDKAAQAIKGA